MTARETSRDIDEAASAWTARLDRGPLTAAENQTFETWLNADPRRKGAFLRARAVSMMSESARALGPGFDPVAFAPASPPLLRRMSRRQALAWTGGATVAAARPAAVVAVGAVVVAVAVAAAGRRSGAAAPRPPEAQAPHSSAAAAATVTRARRPKRMGRTVTM